MTTSQFDGARDTLLRALEQLDEARQELDAEPERCDLIVVYSIGFDHKGDGAWHEIGGWASTSGPKWLHGAMLERAAEAQRSEVISVDDEPDDE